jgi:hypothetical protein
VPVDSEGTATGSELDPASGSVQRGMPVIIAFKLGSRAESFGMMDSDSEPQAEATPDQPLAGSLRIIMYY